MIPRVLDKTYRPHMYLSRSEYLQSVALYPNDLKFKEMEHISKSYTPELKPGIRDTIFPTKQEKYEPEWAW